MQCPDWVTKELLREIVCKYGDYGCLCTWCDHQFEGDWRRLGSTSCPECHSDDVLTECGYHLDRLNDES